jgi:glycosyltransferase involved in cell wall biosynthesis
VNIAHVVRSYGGLTEPFIAQRVATGAELWAERCVGRPVVPVRMIRPAFITAGSVGDRLFHRLPILAQVGANAYAVTEQAHTPDLIHAHYLTTGYLVGRATRAPLVVSTYGFDVTVISRRSAWRSPIRWMARRAARLLVEGPFMRATVLEMGIPDDRVTIVPIAAALGDIEFRPPARESLPVRFMICGRFVEKKGIDIALVAWAAMTRALPSGSSLTIVGSGPLDARLRSRASELGIDRSVSFVGALPRDEYLRQLRGVDILLAPSRTARNGDGEGGAPTAILDAQATGVVVIGSTHADIPFLVQEGSTGFLADEGSAESLSNAIERCLAERERWVGVAEAARSQVHERHSDVAVARQLARVHEEVLAA